MAYRVEFRPAAQRIYDTLPLKAKLKLIAQDPVRSAIRERPVHALLPVRRQR
ncbi:hypothetical protein LI90_3629 [Carbonactinospora thermoautotrophica]|uniref:Uncharacterized protein n=1 Tax=Carbonactinospora thermoautotrophica TaxID=1469144 RepID=A0A132MXX8_9ACTN|nr:hypothetical protein [Carbonactinospora thermoautotrophica]KWX02586.1 hypothetical protein LI90_3629 [Carbonactinospora thermoautotrophica]